MGFNSGFKCLIVYVKITECCLLVLSVCNKQIVSYLHVTRMWCLQVGHEKRPFYTIEMEHNNFKQIGDRMYQFVGKFKLYGTILGVFIDSQTVWLVWARDAFEMLHMWECFVASSGRKKGYNNECFRYTRVPKLTPNIAPCGVTLSSTCRCTEFHRVKNANLRHPSAMC